MLVSLPHGLLDGSDLFDVAEISELKGKQQNYLANRELIVNNLGHIQKILEDLVVSLQTKEGLVWRGKISDAIPKLTSSDLETILVKIREHTFGERFFFEAECSICGHLNKNQKIDLSELEIKKLTYEEVCSSKAVTMPRSGLEAEFKPMRLADILEAVRITKQSQDKLITAFVAVSLKRIGTKSPVTSEDVEDLSAVDIKYLNDVLETVKVDGSIDTDIEVCCSKCYGEFKTKLNSFDPSFFDPSKASMS